MLQHILDDDQLTGPHSALVSVRPERSAVPVDASDMAALLDIMAQECQVWGGGNVPLVPVGVDRSIPAEYAAILPGSAIDDMLGLDVFGLYHVPKARPDAVATSLSWGRQPAIALLDYRKQDQYRPLDIAELAEGDPWVGIYRACLGALSTSLAPKLLDYAQMRPDLAFDDFVAVRRSPVSGSLDDLLERLSNDAVMSPRQLSMVHLGYGSSGSSAIRDESQPLPNPQYARVDAGPNVLVVCSPGSVEDLTLLWNLRAAHGDRLVVPIGLPRAEVTVSAIQQIIGHPRIARNGISRRLLYVTSATHSVQELRKLLPDVGEHVAFADQAALLTLGSAAGWRREEVLIWHKGTASIVPVPDERRHEVLSHPGFSSSTRLMVDVAVPSFPFPDGGGVRADGVNWTFAAGAASRGIGSRAAEAVNLMWPSRLLSAQVAAERLDLTLSESEPGRSAMVALSGLEHPWELEHLAHAPLLELLADMAAQQGMSWYKDRLRKIGQGLEPGAVVAKTADDLPEKALPDFKRVLGGNTKATEYWLFWAERRGLVVKGFPLECSFCRSKQWTPVAAFRPPIICRGCAREMDTPFGDRAQVSFKYRLSERLRRVFEHDALGHLLALRYFQSILGGGRLIGVHPGMEVRTSDSEKVVGEADNLLFLRDGTFVPVEVKRSFSGVLLKEIEKLNQLSARLAAPWSVIIVCQYGREAPDDFVALEHRTEGSDPFRVILSYDTLLEPNPIWRLGADPFAWVPLTEEQITDRESKFVRRLANRGEEEGMGWFDSSMLRRPGNVSS